MDDMYGMLFNSLSNERKLLTAITNKMVDTMIKLVTDGGPTLVNAVLLKENGRTSLHIACREGHHEMLEILIAAGGDINVLDLFNFTPLTIAIQTGREHCVRVLLQKSDCKIRTMWDREKNLGEASVEARPRWIAFSESVLCMMVFATPDLLDILRSNHFSHFLKMCKMYPKLSKAFFLTGNQLPYGHVSKLDQSSSDLSLWRKEMQRVQKLQHYARIIIRKSLKMNVFYGAKQLPLPTSLQDYLQFIDE